MLADAETELHSLQTDISAMEVRTLLSGGEYDDRDALVTVRAEAGGSMPPTSPSG